MGISGPLAAGAVVCALSSSGWAQAVGVEARPGAVVGLAADGAQAWTIEHLSLEDARAAPPMAVIGGRTVYGVGADLLEVDVARGVILARTRFPATIVRLAPEQSGAVTVTLQGSDYGATIEVPVTYRLGAPAPGRAAWYPLAYLGARSDARRLALRGFKEASEYSPEARAEAIARCERAEAADPTNPWLTFFRGQLLQAAGRPDAAAAAFAAAADSQAATWSDLLALSSALEDTGAREPARRAWARGVERMRAAGVRPERMHTLISLLSLAPLPRRALEQAIAAADVERVDEIAGRVATLFPGLEQGDAGWRALASWMRGRGRADLAAVWEERAAAARAGGAGRWAALVAQMNRVLPFVAGAFLALLVAAFVLGARAGARRRAAGGRWPVPRLRAGEVAGLIALLAIALVLTEQLARPLGRAVRYGTMAWEVLDDGLASPSIEPWARQALVPSAAREELLAHARAEQGALRAGGRAEGAPIEVATIQRAIEADPPLYERLRYASKGEVAQIVDGTFGATVPWVRLWRAVPPAALALLFLGALVGFYLPRAARALALAIPGGAESLGILGGVTMTAVAAAAGVLAGAWRMDGDASDALRHFGLSRISPAATAKPAWPWLLLAAAVVLHGAAVIWERRRRRA